MYMRETKIANKDALGFKHIYTVTLLLPPFTFHSCSIYKVHIQYIWRRFGTCKILSIICLTVYMTMPFIQFELISALTHSALCGAVDKVDLVSLGKLRLPGLEHLHGTEYICLKVKGL